MVVRKHSRMAFTMVELLVAVSAFVVLAVLIVAVVGALSNRQVDRRASQQLHGAGLQLEQELQSLATRVIPSSTNPGAQLVWVLSDSGSAEAALVFLSTPASDTSPTSGPQLWNVVCIEGNPVTSGAIASRNIMHFTRSAVLDPPGFSPSGTITCNPNNMGAGFSQAVTWSSRSLGNTFYAHSLLLEQVGNPSRGARFRVLLVDRNQFVDPNTNTPTIERVLRTTADAGDQSQNVSQPSGTIMVNGVFAGGIQ